jgi:mono/diheme cytochrome c family protein
MKLRTALICLLVFARQPVSAQTLTPQQAHGRQLLTQDCAFCHLPGNLGSPTIGPRLSKTTTNGDDSLMKEVIRTGLVKMPGFQYVLSETDIDDLIAYVRTLPVPPPPTNRGGGRDAD